jgi:hypothetical protein
MRYLYECRTADGCRLAIILAESKERALEIYEVEMMKAGKSQFVYRGVTASILSNCFVGLWFERWDQEGKGQ